MLQGRDDLLGEARELRLDMFLELQLKGLIDVPRVLISDKLNSDGATKQEVLPGVEHHQHRCLNHVGEHSH
jgi:putative transposase